MISHLHLGASLYVPATRPDLAAIGNRLKYPALRSVIFCTEDAIRAEEVPLALDRLDAALPRFEPTPLLRFVRVRNPLVLRHVIQLDTRESLTGFVVPKATRHNFDDYLAEIPTNSSYLLMPTLETVEVFDAREMIAFRDFLAEARRRRRILALRIGGNDLLQFLGMRRPRGRSIYVTPLGALITQLALIFRPHGFPLTGPVDEWLNQPAVLARETRYDLARGLFGKSAIHPQQVPVIEAQYRVWPWELEAAERILTEGAAAVFRLHDGMCEPATHRAWALQVLERSRLYGLTPQRAEDEPTCPCPRRRVFGR